MDVTIEQVREMVQKAAKNGACNSTLIQLMEFKSVEDILQHPDTEMWVRWYHHRVGFEPQYFPIIEKYLAEYCLSATKYATKDLNAPFPAGEEHIFRCATCKDTYLTMFPERREAAI